MAAAVESIGYGTQVFIDDGALNAYVQVFNVVSVDPGSEKLNTVESKYLEIANSVIRKVPTLFDGGTIMIKQQFSGTGFARINTLKTAKTHSNVKIIVDDESSGTTIIAPGYFTDNKPSSIEADKITEFDTEFTVDGKRT